MRDTDVTRKTCSGVKCRKFLFDESYTISDPFIFLTGLVPKPSIVPLANLWISMEITITENRNFFPCRDEYGGGARTTRILYSTWYIDCIHL
jgi:hypothetical protein